MTDLPTITILRPGTFTDAGGQVVTLSQGDLEGVVSSYDASDNPAPIVVGHPKLDDPAYGWVKGLQIAEGRVKASIERLEPNFTEAVRAGRYRNVSASLYQPTSPSNPKPGQWYLRHIGFLGAAAPAIKGLGQVSFATDDRTTVNLPAAICRGVTARFNLPCGRVMERDSEEVAARARNVQEHHAALSFADAVVVACLDIALNDPAVSFGERNPDSQAAERFILYRMKRAKLLNPVLSFSEAMVAAKTVDAPPVSFAAPAGWSVLPDSDDLYQRARALQQVEPELGIVQAATRIQNCH